VLLAGCSRSPAAGPKRLADPVAGVTIELPETASGSLAVTPADHYIWSVGWAPHRTLLYFRVLDIQAAFLPLVARIDVVNRTFQDEQHGMIPVFFEEAKAPDGSPVALFAGFDRENNGLAGFAWQGGKTTLAVFALTGPDIKPDRATSEAVLAELWPRLTLSPKDYGVETMMKSLILRNAEAMENTTGDNENIDAAYAMFAMRAHDPAKCREAIHQLCAALLFMDKRGGADEGVRTRAVTALDTFSDILHRDQLEARKEFRYAVGRHDRDMARHHARLLDAFDSPYNPDAKACSRARWERVNGI